MELMAERDPEGGELILEEAREEVVRLVTHPVEEVKRLERVADEGESAATPLILAVGVTAFLALVLAIVLAVVFFAYYDA
jgi:CHASE3 domain sensor protein